jgi:hypothetical protein
MENWFDTDDDGLPVLSNEAKNISCLKLLIVRDKNKPESYNGKTIRPKRKSVKEIAFIYYYLNKSMFDNYENKERIRVIKDRLTIDWEIEKDELVIKALEELKPDLITIEENVIDASYDALYSITKLFKSITNKNKDIIDMLDINDSDLNSEEIRERDKRIEKAKEEIKWVLDSSNQLKTTFSNIEQLKVVKNSKTRQKRKVNRLEEDRSFYLKSS